MEIVSAEEPFKGATGFDLPGLLSGDPMRFKAGRDHRLRLHRLLIEAGTFSAAWIKSVRADGNEMLPFRIGVL